jgi:predicted DNA-binding transcriptional regulator AlpA
MGPTNNQELLSEREVSNWLGISEPTLFRHRRNGTGPHFIRLSARRIAYRRSAIEEWLKGCERQTLSSTASLAVASDTSHPEQASAQQHGKAPRQSGLTTCRTLQGGVPASERGGVS